MKIAYKTSHTIADDEWVPVWRIYHNGEYVRDFIGTGHALIADGYTLASAASWGQSYISARETEA